MKAFGLKGAIGVSCATFALLGALAVGTDACTPQSRVQVHMATEGVRTDAVVGKKVKLVRIAEAEHAGHEQGFFAIKSEQEWEVFFSDVPGRSPGRPKIDFQKQMVLLAYAKPGEAREVRFLRGVETSTGVHVYVLRQLFGRGCNKKPAAHGAYDVIVTDTTERPIQFHVDTLRDGECDAPTAKVVVKCRVPPAVNWVPQITAEPGQRVECIAEVTPQKNHPIFDQNWFVDFPEGSPAKMAFDNDTETRMHFTVDAYGKYALRLEASDDVHNRGIGKGVVEVKPPDGLAIELLHTRFERDQPPETWPRVQLRVRTAIGKAGNPVGKECFPDVADPPTWCKLKSLGAVMFFEPGTGENGRYVVDVAYVDDRYAKSPVSCVRVYDQGKKVTETCDLLERKAGDRWRVGILSEASRTFEGMEPKDAGADAPSMPAPPP